MSMTRLFCVLHIPFRGEARHISKTVACHQLSCCDVTPSLFERMKLRSISKFKVESQTANAWNIYCLFNPVMPNEMVLRQAQAL